MGRELFEKYWRKRLAETMTRGQAIKLLKDYLPQFSEKNLSRETIGKYRKELAKRYHPDTGYVGDELSMLNTALDVLEKSISEQSPGDFSEYNYQSNRNDKSEIPVWAWAGYSGGAPPRANISTEDFTDYNYIKKKAWEISGSNPTPTKSDEYTFYNFDGRYGRGVFTVYANEDTLKTIAGWMVIWDSFHKSKAVLVSHIDFDGYMVFPVIKGRVQDPIGIIESNSFNGNPFNDPQFSHHLNEMLKKSFTRSLPESFTRSLPE